MLRARERALAETRRSGFIPPLMERRALFVWGIPTPEEAESLFARYGLGPEEEASPETWGSWGGILPPVVHAREPLGKDGRRA